MMSINVLIADDNEDTLTLLRHLVSDCDTVLNVAVALDGRQAMAKYWEAFSKGQPFDVILLDLAMSPMDGLTVAKRIREIEQREDEKSKFAKRVGADISSFSHSYLVGITAYPELNVRRMAFKEVMDEILEKPLDIDTIRRLVCDETSLKSKKRRVHGA